MILEMLFAKPKYAYEYAKILTKNQELKPGWQKNTEYENKYKNYLIIYN